MTKKINIFKKIFKKEEPEDIIKMLKHRRNSQKITNGFKYIGFVLYTCGVPGLLYFLGQWNNDLGLIFVVIISWTLIFLIYKYKTNQDQYRYTIERILELDRPLSGKEKAKIYTRGTATKLIVVCRCRG